MADTFQCQVCGARYEAAVRKPPFPCDVCLNEIEAAVGFGDDTTPDLSNSAGGAGESASVHFDEAAIANLRKAKKSPADSKRPSVHPPRSSAPPARASVPPRPSAPARASGPPIRASAPPPPPPESSERAAREGPASRSPRAPADDLSEFPPTALDPPGKLAGAGEAKSDFDTADRLARTISGPFQLQLEGKPRPKTAVGAGGATDPDPALAAVDAGAHAVVVFGEERAGKTSWVAALLHALRRPPHHAELIPELCHDLKAIEEAERMMFVDPTPTFPRPSTTQTASVLTFRTRGRLLSVVELGAEQLRTLLEGGDPIAVAPVLGRAGGLVFLVDQQDFAAAPERLQRMFATTIEPLAQSGPLEIPVFVGLSLADAPLTRFLDYGVHANTMDGLFERLTDPFRFLSQNNELAFETLLRGVRHFKVGWVSVGWRGELDGKSLRYEVIAHEKPLGVESAFDFVRRIPPAYLLGTRGLRRLILRARW